MAAVAVMGLSLSSGLSANAGVVRETVKSGVTESVRISFPSSSAEIDESFGGNASAFSVLNGILHPATDLEFNLTGVKFVGGSSPEGSAELNSELSQKRAKAVYDYFSANYSQFSSVPTSYTYVGRDWTGLLALVKEDAAVPFHDEVVEILTDIVAKDKAGGASEDDFATLRYYAHSTPYNYMYKNIFPALRATTVYVTYDLVKVTEEPEPVVEPEPEPEPEPVVEPEPEPEPEPAVKERKPFYMDIHTNMLYDLAMTPNLGIEFYLGKRWSIAADWQYSWWNNDAHNFYWRNYGGDLTVRKWLGKKSKEKPLQGHHLGVYGQMFTYDYQTGGIGHVSGKYVFEDRVGTNDQPWNWGVGIEYGYSLPVAKRLNIDFSIGVGYAGGNTNSYEPDAGHEYVTESKKVSYIGPTRAEISLIWLIGYGNVNAGKGRSK